MTQIPDINPYLKGGIIGVLFFVIMGLIVVIGWLLKNNLVSSPKSSSGPPRELTAGEKDPAFWKQVFEDIETEGNQALLQVLTEQHRATMEMLGKIRARVRDSDSATLVKEFQEFRAQYRQDMISLVKMWRSIEEKLNDR